MKETPNLGLNNYSVTKQYVQPKGKEISINAGLILFIVLLWWTLLFTLSYAEENLDYGQIFKKIGYASEREEHKKSFVEGGARNRRQIRISGVRKEGFERKRKKSMNFNFNIKVGKEGRRNKQLFAKISEIAVRKAIQSYKQSNKN